MLSGSRVGAGALELDVGKDPGIGTVDDEASGAGAPRRFPDPEKCAAAPVG